MNTETTIYELMQIARKYNFSIVFTAPKEDHAAFVKMVNEWAIPTLDVKNFLKARNIERSIGRKELLACSTGMFETQQTGVDGSGQPLYLISERSLPGSSDNTYPVVIDHERIYHRIMFLASYSVFVYRDKGKWTAQVDRWRNGPSGVVPGILLESFKRFEFSGESFTREDRLSFFREKNDGYMFAATS